jgi:hypothetical protein
MHVIAIIAALALAACQAEDAASPAAACQCPEPRPVVAEAPKPVPSQQELATQPMAAPGPVASRFQPGDAVDISFHGTWYPGRVLGVVGPERWEVGYESYDSDWNLLVGPDRIRARQAAQDAPPSAGRVVTDVRELEPGMTVSVQWHNGWFPAIVRSVAPDGQVRIGYVGYDASWDETVGLDRIRMPE